MGLFSRRAAAAPAGAAPAGGGPSARVGRTVSSAFGRARPAATAQEASSGGPPAVTDEERGA
jgi:hypothetical protein